MNILSFKFLEFNFMISSYKIYFFIFTCIFPDFFYKEPKTYKNHFLKDIFKNFEEMNKSLDNITYFRFKELLLTDYAEKAYIEINNESDIQLKIKLIENLQQVLEDFKNLDSKNF